MKKRRFLLLTYVLITFLSNLSIAQNTEVKPLEGFLRVLEERFDVVFTYADENIRGVNVIIPKNDLTLDDNLKELQKQTGLEFKKLNSRYIAIQKSKHEIKVTGTIIDQNTKEVLPGAVIVSNSSHAVSDNQEQFSIKIEPETDSVFNIRYVGYKHLEVTIGRMLNEKLIFELTPDVFAIKEVVVDYIAKGIDKLSDGAIQMNIKNLEVLPGLSEPDVLHSVQVLPGIQSVNESVSDINTRGGTNDQNLVLWEGVKMYQTGHFFGLISAFNSHLIHKSTVIKNGSSATYSEGVSGIIDMKQQDYLVNKFEVSAGLNMISADAIVKIPVSKKLSLIFGARHSINDMVITPTYKSYYERAFEQTEVIQHHYSNDTIIDDYHDFYFYDLSGKLLYDLSEKDKIRLSFLKVNNLIEYEESAIVRDTLKSKISSLKQACMLSNVNYSRYWNNRHTTHLSAFVSNYLLDGINVALLNDQHHLQKNNVIDWGVKLDSKNQIKRMIWLFSGYHFNEIGIRNQDNNHKPDYNRDVKDVLRVHSLYSEAELNNLFEKLYLRLGLRANYFPEFNDLLIEPRAVLNYNLGKNISFELLAEKKSQYTTQLIDFQSDFLGIEKRRWVLSDNNSVPIIESKQLSVGMRYNRNNFLVSAEAYAKKVTGIITPSQGFQNQYQYVYAIGNYDSHGLEFLIDKQFRQSNIWINYALARNDYYFKEFTPSVFPNNLDVRHVLSVGGNYTLKNVEVSGGFNYRTGKPYTIPTAENQNELGDIIYEEPNNSRLNDYIRLNISAKYNFNIKNVNGEFGVSIWNVLNRANDINIFYQRNDNNEIEQITQHALHTTPNVNLRLRF